MYTNFRQDCGRTFGSSAISSKNQDSQEGQKIYKILASSTRSFFYPQNFMETDVFGVIIKQLHRSYKSLFYSSFQYVSICSRIIHFGLTTLSRSPIHSMEIPLWPMRKLKVSVPCKSTGNGLETVLEIIRVSGKKNSDCCGFRVSEYLGWCGVRSRVSVNDCACCCCRKSWLSIFFNPWRTLLGSLQGRTCTTL